MLPWAALHGMACPLPLRTMSNKRSFQWQCVLICWPHHTLALGVTLEPLPSSNFCQNRCLRSCYSTATECLTAVKERSELSQLFPKPHQPTPWGPTTDPPQSGLHIQGWHLCECVCMCLCVCARTFGVGGGSCHPDAEPSITGHNWNIITRSALGCPDMLPKEASSFILKQR